MSDSSRVERASIQIGDLVVNAFMLPDGSYRMSQSQAAESVGLTERNAREFLQSKTIKSLLGESYTPAIFEIDTGESQARGASRIRGLPLEAVSVYWLWQASRGNKQAFTLCMALMTESLERRFDAAFGVSRSESERNVRLIERQTELESTLTELSEAYALQDDARSELMYLRRWMQGQGLDPDSPTSNE